jgi:hypothetical protein
MQIIAKVFLRLGLKQLTKLLLHQRLEASSPEFVCIGVVIVPPPLIQRIMLFTNF